MIHSKGLHFMYVLLAASFFAFAQAPDTLWTRTYGYADSDECFEMCSTPDYGYVLTGFTNSFGSGDWDVYLLRTDDSGDTLWTITYGGTTNEFAHCMCVSPDGGFVIGGVLQSGDYDIYVFKTDSLGSILWTKTYGGMMNDMADGVCVTTDGGYMITGAANVNNYMTSGDLVLLKLDADGDTVWVKTYGGSSYDFGSAISPTADSGFIICGLTNSFGSGGSDIWLLKIDAEGDTAWTRTFGGYSDDEAWAVQQTSDGGYIITGYTASFGVDNWDVYVVKTNSGGDSLWAKIYGGSGYDVGMSATETQDNGYAVTGTLDGNNEWMGGDVLLLKLDANGDSVWVTSIGGTGEDWGYSVYQTSAGEYIIGGKTWSFGAGQFDVYLVKFGSGATLEEYQGMSNDREWLGATILRGSLPMIPDNNFKIFNITGCKITTRNPAPGIYFIESEGRVLQKVIKLD